MHFYIIDPHPLMRQALARLLRHLRPDTPTTEVGTMHDWPQGPQDDAPMLITLELWTPGAIGPGTVAALRRQHPQAAIAVITDARAENLRRHCLLHGADVFLHKQRKPDAIFQQLRQLLLRRFPDEQAHVRERPHRLTVRQLQLVLAIESGLRNEHMAQALDLSPHTVKVHLWRLFRRFGVSNRVQLVLAVESGLSNEHIAQALALSPHTIKVHLWRLFRRYGVSNRVQLVRHAHQQGLI